MAFEAVLQVEHLSANQHGGHKGHSTATAMIQMYDQWMADMEEGKIIGITMYDQSAAFDVCDHLLLIEKLKLLGLDEKAVEWMQSYLSDRTQSVMVDGWLSVRQQMVYSTVTLAHNIMKTRVPRNIYETFSKEHP